MPTTVQVIDSTKVVVTIPCKDSIEASSVAERIAADVSLNQFHYGVQEPEPKEPVGAKAYPDSTKKKLKSSDLDLLPSKEDKA